jgi:hypothetical protein
MAQKDALGIRVTDTMDAPRVPRSSRLLMPNRKLDELATDVDDATSVLEELQDAPGTNTQDKLEELHDKLEQASAAIDVLEGRTK